MTPAARRVAAWGAAAAWGVLIFLLSSQSDPPSPSWLSAVPLYDKMAHFLLYAVLCALLARALRFESAPVLNRGALIIAVAIAALYGVSDEWHQSFVPGRQPDPLDWTADTLGAICTAAFLHVRARNRAHRHDV